jgi:hypothetical protein
MEINIKLLSSRTFHFRLRNPDGAERAVPSG